MFLKLGDLVFQFILLVELMERGLPVVLIGLFTTLIMFNALWTALAVTVSMRRAGLSELVVDTWYGCFACSRATCRLCVNPFWHV